MIQSTQRKMLRLIIQTKRSYKITVKRKDETNEKKDTDDLGSIGDESEDGHSSNKHNDQDSGISFENDTDEEIDTTVMEEEEWIGYIKRSTNDAMEKMENVKIRCWNKTHKRMKWRLALRTASFPSERLSVKAAERFPELSSKYRTNRSIGSPRRRWEDDIDECLKLVEDETENFIESSSQINKTWSTQQKTADKKKSASWKAAAAPQSASCASQSFGHKQALERNDPEHFDGLMIKNFVMG